MNGSKDEVELIDYLNVFWKRKWLIIVPTLFFMGIVYFVSLVLPKVWEVDAVILPSKYLIQTESGGFEEIVFVDPKQIEGQINQATYNHPIAKALKMDIKSLLKIGAENIPSTKLVRISAKGRDVEEAKLLIRTLFDLLKMDLDKKANIEIKGIDTSVKSLEIERMRIEEEIKTLKNKLTILGKRRKEIEQEFDEIRIRINSLEKELNFNLKKENRSESESLGLLLYSNEIQQNFRDLNNLRELLSSKRLEEENIKLDIENMEERIEQINNKIVDFKEKMGRIDLTELIKEPTSSLYPISPRKKLYVAVTGVLSLLIFIIFAFFIEYIKKQKDNSSE